MILPLILSALMVAVTMAMIARAITHSPTDNRAAKPRGVQDSSTATRLLISGVRPISWFRKFTK